MLEQKQERTYNKIELDKQTHRRTTRTEQTYTNPSHFLGIHIQDTNLVQIRGVIKEETHLPPKFRVIRRLARAVFIDNEYIAARFTVGMS